MSMPTSPTAIRGKVFEALGFQDAPELQVRVDLAVALTHEARRIIRSEGLSQKELGGRIGLDPADLSRLMNGSVGEFSQERLARLLNVLGCEVAITVRRSDEGHPPTTHVDASALLEPVA
jgi:predicted XRE-type DNA-binding protein